MEESLVTKPFTPGETILNLRIRMTTQEEQHQKAEHALRLEIKKLEEAVNRSKHDRRVLEERIKEAEARSLAVPESAQVESLRDELKRAREVCASVSTSLDSTIAIIQSEGLSKEQLATLRGLVVGRSKLYWPEKREDWRFPQLSTETVNVDRMDSAADASMAAPGQTVAYLSSDEAVKKDFVHRILVARGILEAVWETHIQPRYAKAAGPSDMQFRARAEAASEVVESFLCEPSFWMVEATDSRLTRRRLRLPHILAFGDGKDTAASALASANNDTLPLEQRLGLLITASLQGRMEHAFYKTMYRIQLAMVIVFQCQQNCKVEELKADPFRGAPRFDVLQWLVRRLPKQRVEDASRNLNVLLKTCNPLEILGKKAGGTAPYSIVHAFNHPERRHDTSRPKDDPLFAYRNPKLNSPLGVLEILRHTLDLALATSVAEQREAGLEQIHMSAVLYKLCKDNKTALETGVALVPILRHSIEAELLARSATRETFGRILLRMYAASQLTEKGRELPPDLLTQRYKQFYRPADTESTALLRITEAEVDQMAAAIAARAGTTLSQVATPTAPSSPTTVVATPIVVHGSSSSEGEEADDAEDRAAEQDRLNTALATLAADQARGGSVTSSAAGSPRDSPEKGGGAGARRKRAAGTRVRAEVVAPEDPAGAVEALCASLESTLQAEWDNKAGDNRLRVTDLKELTEVAAANVRKAALSEILEEAVGNPAADKAREELLSVWKRAIEQARRAPPGKKEIDVAVSYATLLAGPAPSHRDMEQAPPDEGLRETLELYRRLLQNCMPLSSALMLADTITPERFAMASLGHAAATASLTLLSRITPAQYHQHRDILGDWSLAPGAAPPASPSMDETSLAGALYLYLTAHDTLQLLVIRLRDAWKAFTTSDKPTRSMRERPQKLMRMLNDFLQHVAYAWTTGVTLVAEPAGQDILRDRRIVKSYLLSLHKTYIAPTQGYLLMSREHLVAPAVAKIWSASEASQKKFMTALRSTESSFSKDAPGVFALRLATATAPAPEPTPASAPAPEPSPVVPATAPAPEPAPAMVPPPVLSMSTAPAPAAAPAQLGATSMLPSTGMQTAARQLGELQRHLDKKNMSSAVEVAKAIASRSGAAVRTAELAPHLRSILDSLPATSQNQHVATIRSRLLPLLPTQAPAPTTDASAALPRADPSADPFRW